MSHIALFTQDMAKSLEFYRDFLGFEEQFQLTDSEGHLSLNFIKINDLQSIELFPEPNAGTERLHQIAFVVEDLEALRLHLKSRAIAVPDAVGKGRIGNFNFSVRDPDGHTVEFVQYTPDGWTLQDAGKHMGEAPIAQHLRHVGFMVRSLDASLAFYSDVLGFSETWRGSSDGKLLSWVNLKVQDSDDYIELMLYKDPLSRDQRGVKNHLSLEVSDMPKAESVLKERAPGVNYMQPIKHKIGINCRRLLNLFDPDGTRTELMEPGTVDSVPAPSSDAPAPR